MHASPTTLTRDTWFDVDRAYNAEFYPRSDSAPALRFLAKRLATRWRVYGSGLARHAQELGITPSKLKRELVGAQLKASFAAMRQVVVERPSVGLGERRTTRRIVPERFLLGGRPRGLPNEVIWLPRRWFEPGGLDADVGAFMLALERHVYRELDRQVRVWNEDAMLRRREGCEVDWLAFTRDDTHSLAVQAQIESLFESLNSDAAGSARPSARRARRHAATELRAFLSGHRRAPNRAAVAVARRLLRPSETPSR